MSVRGLASSKMADDLSLCDRAEAILNGVERTGPPRTVMFPSVFWPDRIYRSYLMGRYYLMLRQAVQDRIADGRCEEDPIQLMLDKGHTQLEMLQFTLAALYASIANTGTLCDLFRSSDRLTRSRQVSSPDI